MTTCAPGCIGSALSSLWRGRRTGIGYTPDPTLGNMEDSHSPRSRTRGGSSPEEAAAHPSVMVPDRLHDDHRITAREYLTLALWSGAQLLCVSREQKPGRKPGWLKLRSCGPDRCGAINVEWEGATHLLNCRIITKGGSRPNQIAGDFITYLPAPA